MFALQEHRSIAGVVSIIVHAGVLAAALAGAQQAASGPSEVVILPESLLVAPTGRPSGPSEGPTAPLIDPVDLPDIPGMPPLPGIPSSPEIWTPTAAPGGTLPIGFGAGDSDIFDSAVTDEPPMLLSAP